VPDLWNMAVTQAGILPHPQPSLPPRTFHCPGAPICPSTSIAPSTRPFRAGHGRPARFWLDHAWQASLSLRRRWHCHSFSRQWDAVVLSAGRRTAELTFPNRRYQQAHGNRRWIRPDSLDGTVMFFNSNGTLGSVQSPSGDTITLSYGSGRLTAWLDPRDAPLPSPTIRQL